MARTVGIRLEDKSRWERRVPIVPEDLRQLASQNGLRFVVQPSPQRVFADDLFRQAGAEVIEDLSRADVIFAVKEVPIDKILRGKTYVFFAHVVKGQPYNMPLLRRMLDFGCTLIDYERIADQNDRRLVFFGREAGQAGMIESLYGLGQRLRSEGADSPLSEIRQPHAYADLKEAESHLREVGRLLRERGSGLSELPLIVGFAGYGHTSQGAQEIFDLLGPEEITPEQLAETCREHRGVSDRLFKTVFYKQHMAEPKDAGKAFDAAEYAQHPERYRGRLHHDLPYLTMLVNCIYWEERFPKLLTRRQAGDMWRAGQRKLRLIGDVTCDIDGAIELTHKATQPDAPIYAYDPLRDAWSDDPSTPGILVLAVDNLPCELPTEASRGFSHALLPFVQAVAGADYDRPFEQLDLPPEIHRAVVTHRGELAPGYRYLEEPLEAHG